MPPSSLLVAVDVESFAALGIEPHLSTATVYLDLYLFGAHIQVDFEHFPGCCQLKSLLEKISYPSCGSVFATRPAKNHTLLFCVWLLVARNERTADERKRRSLAPARSEGCSREKRNKWRGPTKWGGGRLCRIGP